MGVKQYIKSVAGAALAPVAKSLWGISPNLSMGISMITGKSVVWDLSGYQAYGNKIFYTGTNLLVSKITEAPITFNKKKSNPKKALYKFYSKESNNLERHSVKSENVDLLPDHELNNLFSIETMEDFWYRYQFGDGVLWFERMGDDYSRNSKPVAVHSLDPKRMTVMTNNGRFDNVDHYLYTCLNGENIRLEKDDVLHLKHWNPNLSSLKGYGVDIAAMKDIVLNDLGNEAEGSAFLNGGRGTLFSSKVDVVTGGENAGQRVGKMTVPEMEALKETIERDMQGAHNNRRMKFTNAEVEVKPYGDTLAEMEVNKSEDSRWKNIYAIMGIPWALTPVASQSSENSVKVGYKALVTNTILSLLRKFDQKLTSKLKQWWPEIVAISDVTEFTELAPDLELMKNVYGAPSITEDERRKIFGYDELGGDMGKAILVPSGMMLLEDIVSPELNVGDSEVL